MWEWIFFYTKFQLFDRLFPTTTSFFLDGRSRMTPDVARTRKCHWIIRDAHGQLMNCISTDCNAWRYINSHPLGWKRVFTKRRGACATSDQRKR